MLASRSSNKAWIRRAGGTEGSAEWGVHLGVLREGFPDAIN